jgi:hypothetical protein
VIPVGTGNLVENQKQEDNVNMFDENDDKKMDMGDFIPLCPVISHAEEKEKGHALSNYARERCEGAGGNRPCRGQPHAEPRGELGAARILQIPLPVKSTSILESMTRLVVDRRVIRVWRAEKSFRTTNDDLFDWAKRVESHFFPNEARPSDQELVLAAAAHPRVSAVEITNEQGNGFVHYTSWP